uniref:Uncharacterized protein n=1 Tax=Nelumbo nucifera TaxID=4432 RepID=A0A822Z3V7_NELNU|nr:TPA_asm: hypothetical protein HUJ06_006848 [Nelumbo nucifera]
MVTEGERVIVAVQCGFVEREGWKGKKLIGTVMKMFNLRWMECSWGGQMVITNTEEFFVAEEESKLVEESKGVGCAKLANRNQKFRTRPLNEREDGSENEGEENQEEEVTMDETHVVMSLVDLDLVNKWK